jgi:hypothetical protein
MYWLPKIVKTNLTDIQVKETANQFLLVHLVGSNLHTAHHGHLSVKIKQLLLVGLSGQLGAIATVSLELRGLFWKRRQMAR